MARSFTAPELEALAAHLIAANQAYVESDGVLFWRAGLALLLIVDVAITTNRRLTEMFELSADAARPFGVVLRQGASTYSLIEAIRSLGYFVADNTTRPELWMQSYALGAADVVEAGQLVLDTGSWNARAARLRTLTAGAGVLDPRHVAALQRWAKTADSDLYLAEALHGQALPPTKTLQVGVAARWGKR